MPDGAFLVKRESDLVRIDKRGRSLQERLAAVVQGLMNNEGERSIAKDEVEGDEGHHDTEYIRQVYLKAEDQTCIERTPVSRNRRNVCRPRLPPRLPPTKVISDAHLKRRAI